MEIVCEYSEILQRFLNEVVQYTLDLYGEKLNISNLQEIKLMDKNEFGYETDGRTYDNGRKIMVTSRLYEMLPDYNIYDLKENEIFRLIVNSLHHEMGHVTDWLAYPNLYKAGSNADDLREYYPALFWLEYIAQKRTSTLGYVSNENFCEQFVSKRWKSYKFNMDEASESNFFYLNKVLPYFMAKTINVEDRKWYLSKLDNDLLKEYIGVLEIEIKELEKKGFFDDVIELIDLYNVMDEYLKKFRLKFTP